MNTYTIYIGAHPIACVCGHDAAYACYEAARTIAEYTNRTAYLVWDETGEQVAGYGPDESEEEYEASCSCEAANCGYWWQDADEDYLYLELYHDANNDTRKMEYSIYHCYKLLTTDINVDIDINDYKGIKILYKSLSDNKLVTFPVRL